MQAKVLITSRRQFVSICFMCYNLRMKTELELIKEFKELFETNIEIASNILVAGSPSEINTNFYTRQKEWCAKYVTKFAKVYEDLKEEKLENRVIRSLGSEENIERLDKVIAKVQKHRDTIIKRKEEEAEAKRKADEEEAQKKQKIEDKRQQELSKRFGKN